MGNGGGCGGKSVVVVFDGGIVVVVLVGGFVVVVFDGGFVVVVLAGEKEGESEFPLAVDGGLVLVGV